MVSLYQFMRDLLVRDQTNDPGTGVHGQHHNQPRLQTGAETNHATACNGAGVSASQEKQKRYFTGTVTSINGESGMIDNHVYFDWDCVVGGRKPVVGGATHVTATRDHVYAGWRATRVDLMTEWRPEEGSETEVVVGVVTGISRTKCVVESGTRDVTFEPSQCRPSSGYHPQLGDSVEVSLKNQHGLVDILCLPLMPHPYTPTFDLTHCGYI